MVEQTSLRVHVDVSFGIAWNKINERNKEKKLKPQFHEVNKFNLFAFLIVEK